ncbi:MAG: hypothetical protein ACREEB_11095 [Caulobacteraceae bacterium]
MSGGHLDTSRRSPRGLGGAAFLAACLSALTAGSAAAVPAFAVQTGQPCAACHVGGFGPQLTPFGREFKMRGYTTRTDSFNVPISAMAVASYVRTQSTPSSPPAPGYSNNDNFTLDQASLFVAGGLGSHIGAFIQATYDGIAKAFSWDNLDVRATTATTVKGSNVVLGASINNAPTVQDPFNTLAAWGFPYTSSDLAPSPSAAPLIGNLAQSTIGVTGYAWINSSVYLEFGGYQSPSASFLTHAGVDPTDPGNIRGTAPYARLAYLKDFGNSNVEIGAFGLWANIYPGHDESLGLTDDYADMGLDASYQLFASKKSVVTVNVRYTHESQHLNASQAFGVAQNLDNNLDDVRLDASYYWHDMIGGTVGAFRTTGSADNLLYAGNRTFSPNSSGLMFQIDGTPFGQSASPLGPRFNLRAGLQYFLYTQFDGAAHDFDGQGSSASGNNTVRAFIWVAY